MAVIAMTIVKGSAGGINSQTAWHFRESGKMSTKK